MNRLSFIFMSLILFVTTSYTVVAADEGPTFMTIDEAVTYALEHSTEIAKSDSAVISTEYQLYQAKATRKNALRAESISPDAYLVASGYAQEAAQLQYEMAKRSKIITERTIAVNVKKDFYTYLNSVKATEAAELHLKNIDDKLTAVEHQYSAGTISELDYSNFKLLKINAENSLNSARRNTELNLITLKNTMNYTESSELIPTGEITYTDEQILSPESAIALSKDTLTFMNIEDTLSLAKRKWDLTCIHFTPSTFTYKIENATYNTAISTHTENINQLEFGIRQTYNTLVTLKEQINAASYNSDLQKRTSEATYLKFEMGTVTANAYNEAVQKYMSSENELLSLILNYNITKLTYENMYTK